MLQFLFDTDHLTLFDHGHQLIRQRHAAQQPATIGISAVTVYEYLRGRLAAMSRHQSGPVHVQAYGRLVASLQLFQEFPIAAFDLASNNQFQLLRSQRLHIGTQDLKIAAIALVNNLTLLTRNRRDFSRVPGIVLDDWSV